MAHRAAAPCRSGRQQQPGESAARFGQLLLASSPRSSVRRSATAWPPPSASPSPHAWSPPRSHCSGAEHTCTATPRCPRQAHDGERRQQPPARSSPPLTHARLCQAGAPPPTGMGNSAHFPAFTPSTARWIPPEPSRTNRALPAVTRARRATAEWMRWRGGHTVTGAPGGHDPSPRYAWRGCHVLAPSASPPQHAARPSGPGTRPGPGGQLPAEAVTSSLAAGSRVAHCRQREPAMGASGGRGPVQCSRVAPGFPTKQALSVDAI
jgi:hypothetical protein